MRARTTLLIFASLLLVGSLASAETPALGNLGQPAMSLLAESSCSTSLAAVPLPGALPAPIPLVIHCGTCSLSPCSGATIGEGCQVGLTRGTCQNVYGNTCGGPPLSWQCQCWNGPLP
jgi:hypothetical protein